MSEAAFKRSFDANFFRSWGDAVGGLVATYVSPGGAVTDVDVLVDTVTDQFGDDLAPVAYPKIHITFRREQVQPEVLGKVTVDGQTYTLAQPVDWSDESLSRWVVQRD